MSEVYNSGRSEQLEVASRKRKFPEFDFKFMQVLDEYQIGRISPEQAIKFFENKRAVGPLLGGQIAIEAASKAEDNDSMVRFILQADELLKKSETNGLLRSAGRITDNVATAKIFRANLPAYATIFSNKLPSEQASRKIYSKIVTIGYQLCEQKIINNQQNKNFNEITPTCIDKIAIESLLSREALKHVDAMRKDSDQLIENSWFAIPATLSFYRQNPTFNNPGYLWDLEIYSNPMAWEFEVITENPIELTTRIQVRDSDHRKPGRITDYSICRVNVNPDLFIFEEGKQKISPSILDDCFREIERSDDCSEATKRLDKRTELLLEALSNKY
jgi:hypothetical protein